MINEQAVKEFLESICHPTTRQEDRDPFCFRIRLCIDQTERDNYRIEPLSTTLGKLEPQAQQEKIERIKQNAPVVVLENDECVQIIDVHKCYSDPIVVNIRQELSSCTQCPSYKLEDCQQRYTLYAQRIEGEQSSVVLINGEYIVYDKSRDEWARVNLKNRCFASAGQEERIQNVNKVVTVQPVDSCDNCKLWKLRNCYNDEIIYTPVQPNQAFPVGQIIEGRVEDGKPGCYEVVELGWWENAVPVKFQRTSNLVFSTCDACLSGGGYIYVHLRTCKNPTCDADDDRNVVPHNVYVRTKNQAILRANVVKTLNECYSVVSQVFPDANNINLFEDLPEFVPFSNCLDCTNSGYTGNIYLIQDIGKNGNILTITVAKFKVVNGVIYGPCSGSYTYTCKCSPSY